MDKERLIKYLNNLGARKYKQVDANTAIYETKVGIYVKVKYIGNGKYEVTYSKTCDCNG